jgi:hypothetical protein
MGTPQEARAFWGSTGYLVPLLCRVGAAASPSRSSSSVPPHRDRMLAQHAETLPLEERAGRDASLNKVPSETSTSDPRLTARRAAGRRHGPRHPCARRVYRGVRPLPTRRSRPPRRPPPPPEFGGRPCGRAARRTGSGGDAGRGRRELGGRRLLVVGGALRRPSSQITPAQRRRTF